MGFLSRLFRGGGNKPAAVEPEPYQGFLIFPEARVEGAQYRVSGRIQLPQEAGEPLEQRFERSDLLGNAVEANALMVQKARRLIDEQGADLFRH